MAILITPEKRVIVQGITGREGTIRTRLMKSYHTQIVAGVTPGKAGIDVEGIPVFDSVSAAWEAVGKIDISVIFVPATLVKDAALEALYAGIKLLVIVPDRVPIYDVMAIDHVARQLGATFIGPNTLGVLSPENGVLGMMGGSASSAREWFFAGPVGITSRSGGITTSIAYYLAKSNIGLSTMVHVGGDAIVGMPHAEVLKQFERDPQTKAVVMFGEIGTSQEENAARLIEQGKFTKPLIAYIGGRGAKKGTRFSHAGAIIEGDSGTHKSKVKRLREVGAHIVDTFGDIPSVTAKVLNLRPTYPIAKLEQRKNAGDLHWSTAITQIEPNKIRLRGYPIDKLMGEITFSQSIYLILTGKLPSPQIGKIIDAILVSSIDHGATPPSVLAARTSASTGAPFNAAIATGLLSINKHHGGAIEDCMRMILLAVEHRQADNLSIEHAAKKLVQTYHEQKKRLPGFGHRIHTNDPRTTRLLELTSELGLTGNHIEMMLAIGQALTNSSGKELPINVDGAIAAILLDLGIPPELGNTFFMIARVPGLIAHIHEETSREKPMRRIDPVDHDYDGDIHDV